MRIELNRRAIAGQMAGEVGLREVFVDVHARLAIVEAPGHPWDYARSPGPDVRAPEPHVPVMVLYEYEFSLKPCT